MGFSGIGIWQLLIILGIVVLVFGTKRLGTLGSDLGSALKGFRSAMREAEDEDAKDPDRIANPGKSNVIDGETNAAKETSKTS